MDEERREALQEYVTELERREVIYRKMFKLKCENIYGDHTKQLNFNYYEKST